MKKKIGLIYTGGTIGMKANTKGKLAPVDLDHPSTYIPNLHLLDAEIYVESVDPPIDSSDMQPSSWIDLVERIERNAEVYDGWVILHGTDTMAFTASALSFMTLGLRKPIVLTGSQLPLGVLRTDAVENMMSALEYACMDDGDGLPLIQEVAVYFEYKLYRGNRVYKRSSNEFNAFSSPNFPALAESGVQVRVRENLLWRTPYESVEFQKEVNSAVGVVTIYPGLDFDQMPALPHWKVLLLRTFGAGNVPSSEPFTNYLLRLSENGTIIVNTSQCVSGAVVPGLYESSSNLDRVSVLSGADLTFESALTKSMILLAQNLTKEEFEVKFSASLCGERT